MTAVRVRIVPADLSGSAGILTQAYSISWADEGLDVGVGAFTVPHDSPSLLADPTLLNRDNVAVIEDDDNPAWPGFGFLIRGRRRTRGDVWDPIQVKGPGVLELLRQALVEYAGGVVPGAIPSDERPFGWMAYDYDDSGWTSPAPYSGGLQKSPRFPAQRGLPESWVDGDAEWIGPEELSGSPYGYQPIVTGHQADDYWYLRDHLVGGYSGLARLHIAADNEFLAYLNGSQIAAGDDWRRMVSVDIELTGNDRLAVQIYNALPTTGPNPSAIIYSITTITPQGEAGDVLFRSTSGAVFSSPQNAKQRITIAADSPPFPWGSSYPGPTLSGTWRIVWNGNRSEPISWRTSEGSLKRAIEGLPGIDSVTITERVGGSGSSPAGFQSAVVEFTGPNVSGRPQPLFELEHDDLRHDHDQTGVVNLTTGRSANQSPAGADRIRVLAFPGSPPGVTIGFILVTLFDEWKSRGGLSAITRGFTATHDSRGVPWSKEIVFVCQVGNDSWLSVAERLREEGVDVWMGTDWVLHAAQQRGDDLSASTVIPLDSAYQLQHEDETQLINALLVRTDDVWFRRGSPPAGTRREEFLSLGLQPDVQSAIGLADTVLTAMARSRQVIRFALTTGQNAAQPYVDFDLMDRITAPWLDPENIVGPWELAATRVDTIAGRVNRIGDVEWAFEVEA